MRAVRIKEFGGPEVLVLEDVPEPVPGPGQVLIEVSASSINPVDVAIRSGWMQAFVPLELPATLGMDVAGVVLATGDDNPQFAVGQQVYGSAAAIFGASGAFAERAVSHTGLLATPPSSVGLVDAGTLPLAGISALQAVTEVLSVKSGDTVLVRGAAGGVGGMAVMIAKSLGATVIAVARGRGVEAARALGADQALDGGSDDWRSSIPPVDAALDLIAADDPSSCLALVRTGGRLASLVGQPDQAAAAERQIEASLVQTGVNTERLTRLAELVDAGVVQPRIHESHLLDDIAAAFGSLAAGGVLGKIAIRMR